MHCHATAAAASVGGGAPREKGVLTGDRTMRIYGIAAAVALPVVIAGCQRTPEPPPAPVMSPAEEACAALAIQAQGLTEGDATVGAVAATKTGATVYDVSLNGIDYTCTVEVDGTISAFGPN